MAVSSIGFQMGNQLLMSMTESQVCDIPGLICFNQMNQSIIGHSWPTSLRCIAS